MFLKDFFPENILWLSKNKYNYIIVFALGFQPYSVKI
jgi:hypothetical protein